MAYIVHRILYILNIIEPYKYLIYEPLPDYGNLYYLLNLNWNICVGLSDYLLRNINMHFLYKWNVLYDFSRDIPIHYILNYLWDLHLNSHLLYFLPENIIFLLVVFWNGFYFGFLLSSFQNYLNGLCYWHRIFVLSISLALYK